MKDNIAIRVEGLSKLYRIGQYVGTGIQYKTLRETLASLVYVPIYRIKTSFKSLLKNSSETLVKNFDTDKSTSSFIWALRDVSFEVKKGEIIGIIGENGAGKSTLLKILTGITKPTEGYAELKGRVGSLLEVGTGFHPELTGRENIYLSGAILGMSKKEIDRRFKEIVEFAGIEKFLDTPLKRYSSGMAVRLGFAVAAHLEPEILLVDEVLTVGDIEFQRKCLGKMGEVVKSGRTILFVSHNLWAVRNLCDRVILLQRGKIIKIGRSDEVIKYYIELNSQKFENYKSDNLTGNINNQTDMTLGLGYRILNIRLIDLKREKIQNFFISEGAFVEITFQVINNGTKPRFSLGLFGPHGEKIFGSLNNTDDLYAEPLKQGIYKTTCRIPGNLLNEGKFSISLTCGEVGKFESYRYDNILSFDCIDDGLLRGDYCGEFSGLIRPKLEWHTHCISNEN